MENNDIVRFGESYSLIKIGYADLKLNRSPYVCLSDFDISQVKTLLNSIKEYQKVTPLEIQEKMEINTKNLKNLEKKCEEILFCDIILNGY